MHKSQQRRQHDHQTEVCSALFHPAVRAGAGGHEAVPLPAPAIGDSWTYQYTDVWKGAKGNINRMEVAAIDEAGIHIDIKRAASGASQHPVVQPEMNPVERGGMHFAPSFARFAFPLAPGKEWSSDVTGNNQQAGKNWRYQIKGKVLDWEKVRVPAGEFDALKSWSRRSTAPTDSFTAAAAADRDRVVRADAEQLRQARIPGHRLAQGRLYSRDSWELTSYVRGALTHFEIRRIADASLEKHGVRSACVAAKQYTPTGLAALKQRAGASVALAMHFSVSSPFSPSAPVPVFRLAPNPNVNT
jgi:hypothetical protein